MTATHRLVAANGLVFYVPKDPPSPLYCQGSRAYYVGSGDRVHCPVCGKMSAVSPTLRTVWAHHRTARQPPSP